MYNHSASGTYTMTLHQKFNTDAEPNDRRGSSQQVKASHPRRLIGRPGSSPIAPARPISAGRLVQLYYCHTNRGPHEWVWPALPGRPRHRADRSSWPGHVDPTTRDRSSDRPAGAQGPATSPTWLAARAANPINSTFIMRLRAIVRVVLGSFFPPAV